MNTETTPKKKSSKWLLNLFILGACVWGISRMLPKDKSVTIEPQVQATIAEEVKATPYFEVPPGPIRTILKENGFVETVNDHTNGAFDYQLRWDNELVTYHLDLITHDNGKIRFMRAEVNGKRREGMVGCEEFLAMSVKMLPGNEALVPWVKANCHTENATTEADGTKVTVEAVGPVGISMIIEPV